MLRCLTCYSHQDGRVKKDMPIKVAKKILKENAGIIGEVRFYNYGEPLINRNIYEMIRYAKKMGIKFAKIATNGMFMDARVSKKLIDSKLDYISISLDGATEATYRVFRINGDFFRVLNNIRNLVRIRNKLNSPMQIEIQFIIMRHNQHELEKIERLSRLLGVDILRYKTILVKRKEWQFLLPDRPEYNRYRHLNRSKKCLKPSKEIVINSDGTVLPCCYIVGPDIKRYGLGNAFNTSLKEILSSRKYNSFVKNVGSNKSLIECCKTCSEGNLLLDYKTIRF